MFTYHLRLALKSLRRNPVLSGLMIGAIALGVGICITTLTVYHLMSGNPIVHRNDVLYAVTLDSWESGEPANSEHPELPPPQVTYNDALAMYASDIPSRKVVMRKAIMAVESTRRDGPKPYLNDSRLTTHEFFGMFDVPFRYGSGWDAAADLAAQPVVVLSSKANDKIFGGANSVGETIKLDGREYKVSGVIAEWTPTPKFYDLNNAAFEEPEQAFIPFSIGTQLQMQSAGNTKCWERKPMSSYQDFLNSECVWLQFWAELPAREQVEQFQTFIDNYVREQKKLGRFQRPLNNRLTRPDEWLRVNEVVADDNRVLVGLSFMFLAVCLLNMIGLLLAKFLGAAPFAGLRRALGASRGAIFQQHLVEAGVIGLGGGMLGILVAALGLLGVRKLYENYDALTQLDLTMVAMTLAIAVISGVIAGLYPTWRVCRLQPATYLKTQ
jgi:putative ABC transport system permease protein